MGSTPDLPMYEEYTDTPFITMNRELQPMAYDYLTRAMENLDLYNANTDAYQAVADAYTQSQWNDLNRGYNQAMNKQAANNYNRLGTSNATSNLYATDSAQRQYNDLASRVASNTANMYNTLVNQEYQRRLGSLGTYSNLFNNAGNITETVDVRNWDTRNQNKDRQYMNDLNNNPWNRISGVASGIVEGAQTGFQAGGPWGAAAGAILGGIGGSGSQNALSGLQTSGQTIGSNVGALINQMRNYNTSNNVTPNINLNTNNYGLNTTGLTGPYSDLINSGQNVSGSLLRNIWNT